MCKSTFLVRNKKAGISGQREFNAVPCGKCKSCVSSRVLQWQFRLEQEIKVSSSAYFVTLTYDSKNVPEMVDYNHKDKTANIFKVLDPRDLTLYFKLLRKRCPDRQLRYYAVGEYGTRFKRPHYHIIMFNLDDVRVIQDTWGRGHVDVSPLRSMQSVPYCLKYLYKNDTYKPCNVASFSRMSKGLGRNYITSEIIAYHNRRLDNCTVSLNNGIILPLPKYMKDKVYDSYARWKLTNYLQERADILLDERIDKIVRATLKSEESVRIDIFNEPYIDNLTPRLVKPMID